MSAGKVIKTMALAALVGGVSTFLPSAPAGAAGMLELDLENVPTVLGVAVAPCLTTAVPTTTPLALPPCSATPGPDRNGMCKCWPTN